MMVKSNNKLTSLRFGTALISLLLSIFAIYSDDLINRDGILYIETAEAFLQGGLTGALDVYNWPFFSIFIAYTHQLTSFSFELSAYIINTLFFVLLTDTLVLLSYKTLPNKQQLLIAALVILCFSTMNEYRSYIIRDIGYWYFCCLTLYRFIQFIEVPTLRNSTIWQIVAVTAALFRIEAIVILMLLPLYLIFIFPIKTAVQSILKLNYIFILSLVISTFFVIGFTDSVLTFNKVGDLLAYIDINSLLESFNKKSEIIEHQVLNKYSASYSAFILSSGLIVMLFYKLIKALTVGYLCLYFFSWWKQKQIQLSPYAGVIIYFLLLNILVLTSFMFKEFFISKRYAIIAILSMLLLILPRLTLLIHQSWSKRNKGIIAIISLVLFVSFIDGIHKSNSKHYVKHTAIWASKNLPSNSEVLTDDEFINYYYRTHFLTEKNNLTHLNIGSYNSPGKRYAVNKIKSSLYNYDYLILVEKRRNKELQKLLESIQLELIYSQHNTRGDKASIYKVVSTSQ
jgi:hypothetical protein